MKNQKSEARTILCVMLFALCALLFASSASAQLAQSGGAGSTISGITLGGNALTVLGTGELNINEARVAGNPVAVGNGTASTGTQRMTIASDNTPFPVKIDQTTPGTTNKVSIGTDGTVAINAAIPAGGNSIGSVGLNTGSNVIGIVKNVPSNACGTTVLNQAWSAVPTSNTAITATTTCKAVLTFNNTNATPQTVSVTDGQGSPITAIGPAFSIPGLSWVRFELEGAMTTGLKWIAGGTGVNGSAVGYQ